MMPAINAEALAVVPAYVFDNGAWVPDHTQPEQLEPLGWFAVTPRTSVTDPERLDDETDFVMRGYPRARITSDTRLVIRFNDGATLTGVRIVGTAYVPPIGVLPHRYQLTAYTERTRHAAEGQDPEGPDQGQGRAGAAEE